jgi:hypothetical protein
MGRPSKLTPSQWQQVEVRFLSGEGASALAREFGLDEAAIRRKFRRDSPIVREAAEKLAVAHAALDSLPVAMRPAAIDLADKLRNVSASLASAAELGAATAHRLQALANSEVNKVDDAAPTEDIEALRGIGVLTKLANESAATGLALMSTVQRAQNAEPPAPAERVQLTW